MKPVLSHVMTVDMRKKTVVGSGEALSLSIFTFFFTFVVFQGGRMHYDDTRPCDH